MSGGLGIVGRLRHPELYQTLWKEELAGQLAARDALRAYEFVDGALAHANIVGDLGHRHQIGSVTPVHSQLRPRLE
jgi:hypothetical protein